MQSEEDQMLQQLQVEEQKIKQYLKSLPYQVILKQKQQQNSQNNQQEKTINRQKLMPKTKQKHQDSEDQTKNKDAPLEMSAKIKVNRFVKIFDDKKRKVIDPRFEQYTGTYNPDAAKRAFSFIPAMQQKQKKVLQKSLSSKKISETERQILNRRFNQVTSSIQANKTRQVQQNVRKQHRTQISKQIKEGRTPFFKSKGIKKDDVHRKKLQEMSDMQRKRFINKRKQQTDTRMQNKKYQFQRRQPR